ncbi:MAG: hypothetical protein DME38_08100 [Verrucomicrobia bacterium]|nr:MAG: hypothetical protein DME38_08100 [Verrucomicrobiota bacterium]
MERENFAGAGDVLAVNSRMTKQVVLGVAAFLGLCLSLGAEQPLRVLSLAQLNSLSPQNSRPLFFQPAVFSRLGDPLLVDGSPGPTTFSNRETFSLATTFNLVGTPTSFLPTTMAMESPSRNVPATSSRDKDSSDYPLDLRPGYYVTGEVGFVYGRSTGKFGGDYKEGYIIGEVGNDKVHITVGASYEDWNGRTFRLGR